MTVQPAPPDVLGELRDSVRAFLASRGTVAAARTALRDPAAWVAAEDALWRDLARQGLLGLHVPESLGGQGGGLPELAVAVEEGARVLLGAGYWSNMAATAVLLRAASSELAAAVARGEVRVAVALPQDGEGVRFDGTHLHGTVAAVADAERADWIVVAARAPAGAPVLAFARCDDGVVRRTALPPLDATRPVARVDFAAAPARFLVDGHDTLLDVCALLTAAECAGVASACLDAAVEHLSQRVAFGRTLASFQALKHRCATMYVLVHATRAAVEAAAVALQRGDDDASALAAMACGLGIDAAVEVATESLLLHGGIGFTWEHDAHLRLRRARSVQALSGGAARHRRRLVDLLARRSLLDEH